MLHDVAKKTWKFHLAIALRRSQDTVLRSLLNDLLGCELQERFEGWQPGSLIPNTYISPHWPRVDNRTVRPKYS